MPAYIPQAKAWGLGGKIDKWVKGKETIRVRLNFTGIRPEDPKVSAIYVEKVREP